VFLSIFCFSIASGVNEKKNVEKALRLSGHLFVFFSLCCLTGNGLIDETEFLTWVAKIQAIKDESSSNNATADAQADDDLTQDLVAAFR
jgi:hypothetical protein